MHAASKVLAGTLVAVALAACSPNGSDNPSFSAPQATPAGAPDQAYVISGSAELPQPEGLPGADRALVTVASGLPLGCTATTELDSPGLLSFAWKCPGGKIAAATVTKDGRVLTLGDLLQGRYESYLSGVAATQFQAEGIEGASTAVTSTFYLTPGALDVVFPAGIVAYPDQTLAPFVRPGSGI